MVFGAANKAFGTPMRKMLQFDLLGKQELSLRAGFSLQASQYTVSNVISYTY